jgi:hypothetical protein
LTLGLGVLASAAVVLAAQQPSKSGESRPLDPTHDVSSPVLESATHTPLPEEYIWTASGQGLESGSQVIYTFPKESEETEKHFFRHEFNLGEVPAQATLYLAGPRWAKTYVNGQLADEVSSNPFSKVGMHVYMTDVAKYLRPGKNVIAVEAVRGLGVIGFANSAIVKQETFGEVLVAKILPAAMGVDAKPLMMTDASWKSTTKPAEGWEKPQFSDAAWKAVQSIGGIESSIELYQWNADAGMYDWPGYDGISPFLAHMPLPAEKILSHNEGRSHFTDLEALTGKGGELGVELAAAHPDTDAPAVLLDFGKELTGRLEVTSDSDIPAQVSIQYGESEDETKLDPYLGVNLLTVAPHTTGYGPKSAFRYVKIRFLGNAEALKFKSIQVDHIYYPVKYEGSFESSDPMLNKIWEVGAYTAHLCMQDGLWDAPKRDRGRWMGDNDISGRTINDVFGDRYLLEDTMDRLIGDAPVTQHVNGIPGYSSFWFTGVAEYYRHTGSMEFLRKTHDRALQLLQHIDAEFDQKNLYVNTTKEWVYVDWSPDLNGDTPESRRASDFEFYRGYREGAWLLRQMGDTKNADFYDQRATAIKAAADKYLLDPATGTYGPRWQTNAMAVLSGLAGPEQYDAIWKNVLSKVGHVEYNALIITPYYNYYVISAMAKMGHQREALEWIRQYWGGMIDEGATSFWEGYDPSWYKGEFHASLQADNMSGYRVSLAHGWSSGPTPWLMEEMLGIHATGAGFNQVEIKPDLMGLKWARGAEPTPKGLLRVGLEQKAQMEITVDVPEGVEARVWVPVSRASAGVMVNGKAEPQSGAAQGMRREVTLSHAGHYVLEGK